MVVFSMLFFIAFKVISPCMRSLNYCANGKAKTSHFFSFGSALNCAVLVRVLICGQNPKIFHFFPFGSVLTCVLLVCAAKTQKYFIFFLLAPFWLDFASLATILGLWLAPLVVLSAALGKIRLLCWSFYFTFVVKIMFNPHLRGEMWKLHAFFQKKAPLLNTQ